MKLSKEDIHFNNTSYIDPMGRVFYWNSNIYRGFYKESSDFFRKFISSDILDKLMRDGKFISTEIVDELEVEGFDLIAKHKLIPFQSYCYEWPMQMLKDAALLTLELALQFCDDDIIMQDATPYNIFFDLNKPVFIDLTSFVPTKSIYLWAPYQQYCNFFLFPLYLYSSGHIGTSRKLLFDTTNGISSSDVSQILDLQDKFKLPGYVKRISVPEFFSHIHKKPETRKKMDRLSSQLGGRLDMKNVRKNFFKTLKRNTEEIILSDIGTHWSDYYDQTEKAVLQDKLTSVSNLLDELSPGTMLDVGCNVGEFSVEAARKGIKVVALDTDPDCINRLYKRAVKDNLNILPLIMDILAPSPGTGWRCIEFSPAKDRFQCELVTALALIHHLTLTHGQTFERIVQSLKDFKHKWLIVEYVDINDPMAKILNRRPNVDYSWYTLKNFINALGTQYKEVKTITELSSTRTLLLAYDQET